MARDRHARYGERGRFWHGAGQGFPPRYGERRISAWRGTGTRTTGNNRDQEVSPTGCIETRRSLLPGKEGIKIPS